MRKLFLFSILIFLSVLLFARDVKVLIAENKNNLEITSSSAFSVKDLSDNKTYQLKKGGTFKVKLSGGKISVGSLKSQEGFLLIPKADANFVLNSNKYIGELNILPSKNGVNVIEVIDLEKYLLGVLPYEMSPSWPLEALKAQAVAARTYTLKSLEDKKSINFDLYSDVRSQMYKGAGTIYKNVQTAVEETKGEVLKYKDNLFYTYYHANCGGHTDEVPWLKDLPTPLQGAKCGYCSTSKSANWNASLKKDTVNQFLKKNKILGTIKKIKIGKKYASGRAKTLILTTTKTKKEVNCNTFRVGVGSTVMRSCFLTKIDGLKLEGKGFGHGAGMCQDGAKGMALAGKDYKDILENFYPASKIYKI